MFNCQIFGEQFPREFAIFAFWLVQFSWIELKLALSLFLFFVVERRLICDLTRLWSVIITYCLDLLRYIIQLNAVCQGVLCIYKAWCRWSVKYDILDLVFKISFNRFKIDKQFGIKFTYKSWDLRYNLSFRKTMLVLRNYISFLFFSKAPSYSEFINNMSKKKFSLDSPNIHWLILIFGPEPTNKRWNIFWMSHMFFPIFRFFVCTSSIISMWSEDV